MCFVSLNPMVTAIHKTMSIQLISGIYICPCILSEVWTTLTLGKQPSDWLWLMIENVPLMIAWLPTTAARMAIINTGHLTLSAPKNLKPSYFFQPQMEKYGEMSQLITQILVVMQLLQITFISIFAFTFREKWQRNTWNWAIETDLIARLMMVWQVSSLPHIRQYKCRINQKGESNLQHRKESELLIRSLDLTRQDTASKKSLKLKSSHPKSLSGVPGLQHKRSGQDQQT